MMNSTTEQIADILRDAGYLCVHHTDGDRTGEVIERVVEDGYSVVDWRVEGMPKGTVEGAEFFAMLVKHGRAATVGGVMLLDIDGFELLVAAIVSRCEKSGASREVLRKSITNMTPIGGPDVKEELTSIIENLQELVKRVSE